MIWSSLNYLGVASQGFPWFSPPLWLPTIIVLAALFAGGAWLLDKIRKR